MAGNESSRRSFCQILGRDTVAGVKSQPTTFTHKPLRRWESNPSRTSIPGSA